MSHDLTTLTALNRISEMNDDDRCVQSVRVGIELVTKSNMIV